VQPAERHALDAIARDLEATDPLLARELTGETLVPGSGWGGRDRDWWAHRLILVALWTLGLGFGATLLGLGLAHQVELTAVVGATVAASVVTLGTTLICYRRCHG
jgi:hypothetical protein